MNQKQTLEEIIRRAGTEIELLDLLSERKLKFPVYVESPVMNEDVSELELSVRSSNCLRRAGFHTVGDLINGIEKSDDLLKIRNCGENSVREIMRNLFIYQYSVLTADRQEKWIEEVRRLNS